MSIFAGQRVWISSGLLAVCFVTLNMTVRLSADRVAWDATQDKVFSLSPEAAGLAADYHEPITFRFFYSNKMANGYPAIKNYAARIVSLLESYASASKGEITVQVIDPEPFSQDEDLAASYGLKAAPLDDKGNKIYFGLAATNSVDETRLIPVFHFERESFLEYDLGRIIVDLSEKKKPKIGILTSLAMDAPGLMGIPGLGGGKSWMFLEQLRQNFETLRVEEDAKVIPEEYAALLVAQPKKMNDDLLYALDQYALKGGRIAFFLDPNAEGENGSSPDDASFSPDLNRLLRHWGVFVDPAKFAADRYAARPVRTADNPEGRVDYLGWLELRGDRINHDDIVNSKLETITVATPGAVQIQEGAASALKMTPMLQTESEAMLMPVSLVKGAPDPKKLLEAFHSENQRYVLAARLQGDAATLFPNRRDEKGHVAKSTKPLEVTVVADTDLLKDQMWARSQEFEGKRIILPTADNGDFAVNILDHLGGNEKLVRLRGKGLQGRPFEVTKRLKKDAEMRYMKEDQRLKESMKQTEERLASLKHQADQSGGQIYQAKQQEEIRRFTEELQTVKRDLRKVEFKLNEDIDRLGSKLKLLNIWAVPVLIGALAAVLGWRRRRMALLPRLPLGYGSAKAL